MTMNQKEGIRPGLSSDTPAIAQVLITVQKLHADAHPETFRQPESVAPFLDEVQRLFNEPDHLCLVAEESGVIVGYLMAEIQRRDATIYHHPRTTLYIHQLAVLPAHQQNGHGARLIDAAKALAQREGLARIGLDTWEFNTKAQRFFHKQGFSTFNQRMWLAV